MLSNIATSLLKERAPAAYGLARALRLRIEQSLFREYICSHCYGGHKLSVIVADRIGRLWYDRDYPRPSSFDLLFEDKELTAGARVFALGAHQSVLAMMVAREIGERGVVVAVEAGIHNAEIGRRNVLLNAFGNIVNIQAAVSGDDGTILFSQAYNGMVETRSDNVAAKTVAAVTIDTLAQRFGSPDIVMIDIEGYEYRALQGGSLTLSCECSWYVEVHGDAQLARYGATNRDVVDMFGERFRLFYSGDDITPFVALNSYREVPSGRFFLVALAKSRAGGKSRAA